MKNESTDARAEKSLQKIKLALIGLLSEKRLDEITVSELSQRAQINRKTFYRHYTDVEEAVGDLEQKLIDDLLTDDGETDMNSLDLPSLLRRIGATVELNKEQLVAVTRHNPELFTRGRLRDILRSSLRAALKPGARFESRAEQEYAVNYLLTGIIATFAHWLRNGCQDDVELVVGCVERMTALGCSAYPTEEAAETRLS